MNVLYLDDYINLYIKSKNKIYIINPYKDTLKNGLLINRHKFIKKIVKELNKIGIKNTIFANTISVITNNNYSYEDKELLKITLEELNYKNIKYINENSYLNINKQNVYVNCNYNYFYILFIDYNGNTKLNMYKNDSINKKIFINLINSFNNKNIFIYGKNYQEFITILDKYNKDYYVYEDSSNLIIKKILNSQN